MSQPTPSTALPAAVAQLGYESSTVLHPPLGVTLGFIGLRLLGLYLATMALASLPTAIFYLVQFYWFGPTSSSAYSWIGYIASSLLMAGFGWMLFAKAPEWSRSMFGQLHDEGHGVSPTQLLTLMIAAIGLWLVASSCRRPSRRL